MTAFNRGDMVLCVLSGDYGKPRPALIVQSDLFNPTHASITICPLTTHLLDTPLFRLPITPSSENGIESVSQIMIDKISTLSTDKIRKRIGKLTVEEMEAVNKTLKLWLDL